MTFGTRIDRYVARLILVPMLGAFCLAAMLLLLDRMLYLFDFVIRAGGPMTVVWQMLANLVPEYMGLAIPVGLTLGILLAFRKLAISSELDALHAVGLGIGRLLRVPYSYAALLLVLNLWIVGFVQPRAQYAFQNLQFDLRSGSLGASIKVGEFTYLGQGVTLRVEHVENQGTDLYGVFLRMRSRSGRTVAVSAARGRFLATDNPNTILFRLINGRLVNSEPGYRVPRVLSFVQHELPISMPAIESFRGRGGASPQELTLVELARSANDPNTQPEMRNQVRASFHFRLVEASMLLFVPLLAVALAVPPKRSTSGLGIFVSIVVVVVFHKISQYAQQMGALGRIDPAIALWVPFLAFGGIIVWMYYTLAHKPGGQPLGAVERAFARSLTLSRRLLHLGNPPEGSR